MAGNAGAVVDLRTGHRRRDGLWIRGGLDDGRCRFVLLAGHVNPANGANTVGDGGLVFGRITRVNTLRDFRHLHGEHEYSQCDRGEHADDERIHIKKFLVPTQGTAPEI
ncbi:MAG: hypothetical protein P8X98_11365 [Woeseiaceae bacterium]